MFMQFMAKHQYYDKTEKIAIAMAFKLFTVLPQIQLWSQHLSLKWPHKFVELFKSVW